MSRHTVRRPVIAGNWKMNKGPGEAADFCRALTDRLDSAVDCTVILFPPAISLGAAQGALNGRSDIALGVQNVHWEVSGAFTGEISAVMAAQAGAAYVLSGHSERRQLFGETDEQVGLKAAAILGAGLLPIACVGETLEQRNHGELEHVLSRQLDAILDRLPGDAAETLFIAYEPVWAIGTGVNATPADASGAHEIIRRRLASRFGPDQAGEVPILYGGSVKPDNAGELLDAVGVDGLLVGGASLDPVGFARILAAAKIP